MCVSYSYSFSSLGFTLFTIVMEGLHSSTDAISRVIHYAHIVYELDYVGINSQF